MKAFGFPSALAALILATMALGGCEEDSGPGDPLGKWPDSVKPIVGWFATQRDYLDTTWGNLYFFDGSSVTEVETPGDSAFQLGSMAGPDAAWATDWQTLYELHDGEWRSFPRQPRCPHERDYWIAGVAVFSDGGGYVSCQRSKTVLRWDDDEWRATPIPDWSGNTGGGLQCIDEGNCLVWAGAELSLFDGEEFVHLPNLDSLDSFESPVLLPSGDICILEWLSDYESPYRLLRYEDGEWTPDRHFTGDENWFFNPTMTRLGPNVALSAAWNADDETRHGTLVLAAGSEIVDPGWPQFRYMAFASGGGGLAVDDNARVVYWVDGLDLKLIYEFSDDEAPSGFLVVADKE